MISLKMLTIGAALVVGGVILVLPSPDEVKINTDVPVLISPSPRPPSPTPTVTTTLPPLTTTEETSAIKAPTTTRKPPPKKIAPTTTTAPPKTTDAAPLKPAGSGWKAQWALIKSQFPDASLMSGFRPGDPGYHGRGQAIDIAASPARMLVINAWIALRYPKSTELIYTPGINLWHGLKHLYSAATRADHYDHVHWAYVGPV